MSAGRPRSRAAAPGGTGRKPGARANARTKRGVRSRTKSRAKGESAPKRSFPRLGKRTILAFTAAVLGVAASFGVRVGWDRLVVLPAFAVREVEVAGAARADAEELVSLAGIVPGDRWLDLEKGAAIFRLESHPWVAKARVRRPAFGRVRLAITECVPLARLRLAGGVYGVCDDLRVLPDVDDPSLPLISLVGKGRDTDPEVLARGVRYVEVLAGLGFLPQERIEVELGKEADRLRFEDRGFEVRVEGSVEPGSAVRNAAAFLERLDAQGESRGTLRLISEETAVWKAA